MIELSRTQAQRKKVIIIFLSKPHIALELLSVSGGVTFLSSCVKHAVSLNWCTGAWTKRVLRRWNIRSCTLIVSVFGACITVLHVPKHNVKLHINFKVMTHLCFLNIGCIEIQHLSHIVIQFQVFIHSLDAKILMYFVYCIVVNYLKLHFFFNAHLISA